LDAGCRERDSAHLSRAGHRLRPYSPLGRGFLTGRFKRFEDLPPDDYRRYNPRFQGGNFQKNLELVRKIEEIAAERRCTPGQLALAWVLAQGDDIVPIPGTKRRKYLEENAAAAAIELTPAEVAELAAAVPPAEVAGDRYTPANMKYIDR